MLQQNYKSRLSKQFLENLYKKYNHRVFVSPDPLQFLYDYSDIHDREIVGLIASALAYGRVRQILKSISAVLDKLGPSPLMFLKKNSLMDLQKVFKGFKHRFTTGDDISLLLSAIKHTVNRHGSLCNCFKSGMTASNDTSVSALTAFVDNLGSSVPGIQGHTVPSPKNGSACKRLNLFLRWMIRNDNVDPGGWENIPLSILIIPLDTHMYRIGHAFGFTTRKQADLKAALEITEGFRQFSPRDPVRYDFALTRFGIRDDLDLQKILNSTEKRV